MGLAEGTKARRHVGTKTCAAGGHVQRGGLLRKLAGYSEWVQMAKMVRSCYTPVGYVRGGAAKPFR